MTITAEACFVKLCACEPDPLARGVLRAAATRVEDWGAVVRIAEQHRVTAFVRRALVREDLPIPAPAAHALRRAVATYQALAMLLDAELARTTSALATAGIPVIVLKGPVLARSIYPDAALRPYGDIDLTVQEGDDTAAAATLRSLGYQEIPCGHEEARRARAWDISQGAAFHRMFIAETGGVQIDLHVDPLQLGLKPLCEAERWRRALPLPWLPNALTLCAEDQVVHLTVHAHKHGFNRLIWLKDLDLLLRSHGDRLDWHLIRSVARKEGVQASVWYSLHLARMIVNAPVPSLVLRELRPAPLVRWLYGAVWPPEQIAGLNGHMRRRAVQFLGADSTRGTLPSLILMGRRRTRASAAFHLATRRLGKRPADDAATGAADPAAKARLREDPT